MDRGLVFDPDSQNYNFTGSYTKNYCPDNNCDNDKNKISSAFIALLGFYKDYDMINSESDKIVEYAILWLGHKLNQKTENRTITLNDFYTKHIEKNSKYIQKMNGDSYNKINKDIKQKIESMDIGIEDISNFYEVFKLLCKMDGEVDKKKGQCNTCLENAGEFFEKCEKVKNVFDINKGSSYLQLLSSLSNDYKKFKEKYKKVCNNTEFLESYSQCSVTKSTVTECPVTNSPATNSPVTNSPATNCPATNCPVTECPVSKNTLITIAIIFVAASILLGVSYKCGEFDTFWRFFSDELDESGNYNFKKGMLKNYCPSKKCDSDIDKINAGCLWLFNKFYGSSYNFSSNANGNMNIVIYIMTWISYKLNQKPQNEITNLKDFYSKNMQNVEEYKKFIDDDTGYTSYNDLINKKNKFMDIDISVMSKFYGLFKILCNMHINVDKKSMGNKYLENAAEFVDEYKKLFNDDNNAEGNSYNQILSTLSNDYDYFRNKYVDSSKRSTLPELIKEKTTQVSVSDHIETQDFSLNETSESKSETDTSSSKDEVSDSDSGSPSSSILNKLISIPFIFVATLILLGISYKYSLFGFRKRSQKQHLRKKLKK
ncbi:hypothetical protein YYC_01125 [Plasmodium yoelii 17X]|uniref:YIR protein n=1 Tax=Plasmodium yoelii 17X TaxID=1323249 RepID=V7PNM4_PLAYE|nr:hypothetical protein YYC_01125 [Plasmodium yoelii 17X]